VNGRNISYGTFLSIWESYKFEYSSYELYFALLKESFLSHLSKARYENVATKENKKSYSLLLTEISMWQYNFIKCRICNENLMNSWGRWNTRHDGLRVLPLAARYATKTQLCQRESHSSSEETQRNNIERDGRGFGKQRVLYYCDSQHKNFGSFIKVSL
jgi:hypothetical protein